MKKINKTIIATVLSLLLGSSVSFGQQLNFGGVPIQSDLPDTLRIDTDSNISIVFAFNQMSKKEQYLSNELWKSILNVMETSFQKSIYDGGVDVTYYKYKNEDLEEARILVTPFTEKSDLFIIGKEGMEQQQADRIAFHINLHKIDVSFFVNSLEELEQIKDLNVESLWTEIESNDDKFTYKRSQYLAEGHTKYGDFTIDKIETDNPIDFIELSGAVGLGYYADRFVPDVTYDLGFRFHNRFGKPSTKFGLLYTQHFFMSRDEQNQFEVDLNGFLSAYFSFNSSADNEFGLGFGYLINQNGDFYKGNTYKLTLYNKQASKTSLSPELIFVDDFKRAFPALRFGLTF